MINLEYLKMKKLEKKI